MKGNRAEQSRRLNLLCGGMAMNELFPYDNSRMVLVRRYDGTPDWVDEITVIKCAHSAWAWAPSGEEYGYKYYELYQS